MKPVRMFERLVTIGVLLALLIVNWTASTGAEQLSLVQTPLLKWQHGGCYSSWCETGWYSSPAVADLDDDGKPEVIGATYSLFVLNGDDGSVRWSIDPPGGRVWPGVVVADIDHDGDLDIVTAHGGGYVNLFDHEGHLVWSRQPSDSELRGLSVYDLDGDNTLEIIATAAVGSKVNTWVLEHDGSTRPGWPQLDDDSGYAYGVFNANASVGDLDGDGQGEIVVPSDVHYICAYQPNGAQLPANVIYGDKDWGAVGVWESLATEQRGWGTCSGARAERYRTNFAHGPSVIADVDGDGINEVVVTGNVYDCGTSNYQSKYDGVYVVNADRSRFNQGGFDWRSPPVDAGAPLSEDWNEIENAQPNPAVADLDNDGRQEVIYSSYDGRVHAFWLDKTEHGNWPYAVTESSEGFYRFASEPAVADLDDDGQAEVVVASWVQKGTGRTGRLHILDALGHPLQLVDLPPAFGGEGWNGALAGPTLANIDADADIEVVLVTASSGIVAYDLPGSADARILWGTGRGNYWRSGSWLGPALTKKADRQTALRGDVIAYTITLAGSGRPVVLTDTIPAGTTYVPQSAVREPSLGNLQADATSVRWTGTVPAGTNLAITLSVTVTTTAAQAIVNRAQADDGQVVTERHTTTIANGQRVYLPTVRRR
jgi:uncharacterized repeat protein (TIGR01451 family)